uniref:Putative secreted protein n=1 Tax=Ixodes ricinus TaxID=34613 RepID=A0A6B0UFT8_IXORI
MCIFMCSLLYLNLFAETVSECASIFEHILLFIWQFVGEYLRRIQIATKGCFFLISIHDICANVCTRVVTFLSNIFLIFNIIYVMQTS